VSEFVYQITSSSFCAGIEFAPDGTVIVMAPILRKPLAGMGYGLVSLACAANGWLMERVA
jgi:hypothetical protein